MKGTFNILFALCCISWVNAQDTEVFMTVKSDGEAKVLWLDEAHILSLHKTDKDYVLRLFDQAQNQKDEFILENPGFGTELALCKLGPARFFLSTGELAYNFSLDNDRFKLTDRRPFPSPPRSAVKTLYFFDGDKRATVFLNAREQYNVYIDSAGVRLDEKVTFNTSHIGNLTTFEKRKAETPDFIYSYHHQELFFHMPTDVSILSIDLKKNKIDIGLIYMEYEQSYVFRRYYDQATGQRYALKQDKSTAHFFKTPAFGVLGFTKTLNTLSNPMPLKETPHAVVNGRLLFHKSRKIKKGQFEHTFYLRPIEGSK